MADVAACHQPITFDFAALVIHPVVCQIGQTGQAHVDIADCIGGQLTPLRVEDLNHSPDDRSANGARIP